MKLQQLLSSFTKVGCDGKGVALLTTMLILLMTGVLGVAALTMTGMENSMAGAVRMLEEGTHAAESCVGTAVRVINLGLDNPTITDPAVPVINRNVLSQEISGHLNARNNPDVAVGAGNAPNLVMNTNGYNINGDIDFLYSDLKKGGDSSGPDAPVTNFYRIDCTAANAATGTTSRVIAVFECLFEGDTCERKSNL